MKNQGLLLLDYMIRICLVLWETIKSCSQESLPFCILVGISSKWEFLLFHILTGIWYCQCFAFWPLQYMHMGFSLFINNVLCWTSFHMLIFQRYIFYRRCLFRSLSIFKIRLLFFSNWWVLRVLCIFQITVLCQICIHKFFFFPCLWLIFSFSWHCLSQSRNF